MTLRELVDFVEIQGNGIVQLYDEEKEEAYKIHEWEYDLISLPEELEDLYVKYMWAEKDKMIIEVSKERY